MDLPLLIFSGTTLLAAVWSVYYSKLTLPAALLGVIIAALVFAGTGLTGFACMGLFFVMAVAATHWRASLKIRLGVAERNKGKRNAGQVLANGFIAGLAGLLATIYAFHSPLMLAIVASAFSAAAADTISTEVGTVISKRNFDILTLRPATRGQNGVISLEGTLAGVLASAAIAICHAIGTGSMENGLLIIAAGTSGNIADSLMGATLERKGWVGNDGVNLLNTFTGALVAFYLF